MKSELRNLINCIETPHPQGQVFYLEPVVLKESQSMWTEEGLPFASPNNSSYRYLRKIGFKEIITHPDYWVDVDYICTRDGNPCHCTAIEMHLDLRENRP